VANKPFLTDIKTLRERARQHIENGAVTEGYKGDRETVVKLLNEALATELFVCCATDDTASWHPALLPKASRGILTTRTRQGHADQIAQRIDNCRVSQNFNPEGLLGRTRGIC
jgi:bacterioferritin